MSRRKTEIFLDPPDAAGGYLQPLFLRPIFFILFNGSAYDQATRHPFTVSDHKCHRAFGLIRLMVFTGSVTIQCSRREWAIKSGSSEARHCAITQGGQKQ